VRRRDALAEIVPALKAAGIAYRAIEIERLGEKQVVQDLYALARGASRISATASPGSRSCALPGLLCLSKNSFEIAGRPLTRG